MKPWYVTDPPPMQGDQPVVQRKEYEAIPVVRHPWPLPPLLTWRNILFASMFIFLGMWLANFLTSDTIPPVLKEHLNHGKFLKVRSGTRYIEIFLRDEGPRHSEAVLMLHGIPTSSFLYRKVIPEVADRGFRAISFDWPGLGFSDKPDINYNWHWFSDVLDDVITQLGLARVHLVLHDIAGPIGTEWAIKNPDVVLSITYTNTFLDTQNFTRMFPMYLLGIPVVGDLVYEFMTRRVFDPLRYLLFSHWSSGMSYDDSKSYAYLLQTQNGKKSLSTIASHSNWTSDYTRLLSRGIHQQLSRVPIQTIWSEYDALPNSAEHEHYLKTHFNIERELWAKAKHLIQEDIPSTFAQAVVDFVKRHR